MAYALPDYEYVPVGPQFIVDRLEFCFGPAGGSAIQRTPMIGVMMKKTKTSTTDQIKLTLQ